jgi:triosephosphate isomerase
MSAAHPPRSARVPIVAANWKMHLTRAPAVRLVEGLRERLEGVAGAQVILCPPATALESVGRALEGSSLWLGAQTMHWEAQGAYTGEVSAPMLVDLGCRAVILGHSERRMYFCETDEAVSRKVAAALAHGLLPIVCVGERAEEREAGATDAVIARQVEAVLRTTPVERYGEVAVAYEPVWAIGTGRSATGEEANRVAGMIRGIVGGRAGPRAAASVRILYGGSVKPENISEFLRQPEVDGALVGGASLEAEAFAAIVRAAVR